MKPEMKFIERIFTDANIDVQLSEEDGIITITFVVGDVVNGLSYRRELCLYDIKNFTQSIVKLIDSDILTIKAELRNYKLNILNGN